MSETATRDALLCIAIILSFGGLLYYIFSKLDAKTSEAGSTSRIVNVLYLGSEYGPQKGSKLRLIMDSLFFGLPEGLVFSALEREILWHSFQIHFDNGKSVIKSCPEGSAMYDYLMAKVHLESSEPSDDEEPSYTYDELPAIKKDSVDWNEQAVRAAKEWLEFQPFSRKALIEQLEEDGFTHEQAEYAADAIAR